MKEGKDEGRRAVLEKRRETNASYSWGKVGLADEAGSDVMPDAAGGAAKPEGVIHRNIQMGGPKLLSAKDNSHRLAQARSSTSQQHMNAVLLAVLIIVKRVCRNYKRYSV